MRRTTTQASNKSALKGWMVPPPYIMNAELRRPSTEQKLFADWPETVEATGRLSPDGEILLFKQLHFSGHKLSQVYKQASKRPTKKLRNEFFEWVQRHNLIRTRIIEANLGLVYDMIGRTRFEQLDRDELTSEGMMALLRAADTFDPWRGYRFSTYACNAIIRAFSRAAMMDSKRRSKIAGPFDVEFEKSDATATTRTDQESLFTERLGQILHLDHADLTDVEKTVLERRFPFDEEKPRQTLEDIGRKMRVSKERVRQIQLSAIAKLRRAIRNDPVLI